MKIIIAGSRTLNPPSEMINFLLHNFNIWQETDEIVSGAAKGVDEAGACYARGKGNRHLKEFPANWNLHGKAAGPIRNKEMAEYADVLLLIWDGESKGSANMKMNMEKLKKPIYEVIIKGIK